VKNVESDGQKPSAPQQNEQELYSLVASMALLTQAIAAQTEAINRLAISNEMLVNAMIEDDESPESQYLNGWHAKAKSSKAKPEHTEYNSQKGRNAIWQAHGRTQAAG
jgi:hypothetical protein